GGNCHGRMPRSRQSLRGLRWFGSGLGGLPCSILALLKSGVCDDSAHASWHLEAHTAASAVKTRYENAAPDVLHLPHVQAVWLDVVAGGEVALVVPRHVDEFLNVWRVEVHIHGLEGVDCPG